MLFIDEGKTFSDAKQKEKTVKGVSEHKKNTFLKNVIKVVRKTYEKKRRENSLEKSKKKTLSYHLMCNLINIIVILRLIRRIQS